MVLSDDSLRLLACPRCSEGKLTSLASGLRCKVCSRDYPTIDGIACLVPDPDLWRAQWRSRLDEYAAVLDARVAGWRAEAGLAGLLPRTRARVSRVADAMAHEQTRIRAFADLLAGPSAARHAALLNRATEQDTKAVVECDEHVFRDWAWGQGEVDGLRAFAERLIPERPQTMALYGVGAGRLAVDIHRSLGLNQTFALDWNPLPLWVAGRLLGGETLEIYELPLWPSRDEDVVVRRSLKYSEPVPPGFAFLIADAAAPPLGAGSVDAVLTSWFIDAVHTDLRELAPSINRVLRPGGLWINVGPLRFKDALSRAYSIEEVHEIVELSGFGLVARERADLPYFAAPLGGTRALETVFGFAARKTGEAEPFEAESATPPWLIDTSLPVQATPGMARLQQSSIIAAGIISLVDGVRSITEITKVLAATWKIDPAEVEPQLRAFFASTESGD